MIDLSYLKLFSYAFNAVVAFTWLKRKLIQTLFLSGRWEGTLLCIESDNTNKDILLVCTLVVTNHPNHDNQAILYYEQENISRDRKKIQGVDKLHTYDENSFFFWNKVWKPQFVRLIHFDGNTTIDEQETKIQLPKIYHWDCKICSMWFKEKMNVSIKSNDVTFVGSLQKI